MHDTDTCPDTSLNATECATEVGPEYGFRSGIDEAVYRAGNRQTRLAKLLGCTSQCVNQWVAQGWVPLDRAIQIEELLGIPRRRLIDPELIDKVCSSR
jgi:uncharacterized metal-binding protein